MKQTVLITGASMGIGYELAKIFGKNGDNLVLVSRNERKLSRIVEHFTEEYDIRASYLIADLSKPESAEKLAEEIKSRGIVVDVLVNNAGFGLAGPFSRTDWAKEKEMLELNITSLTALTKAILPGMLDRKKGRIANVASIAGFMPGPFMAVYYATKAYVLSFSEALAEELDGTGITVTAVCPGPTVSGFQKRAEMEELKLVKNRNLMTSEQVAKIAYQEIMNGKVVAVTGLYNKILTFLVRLAPRSVVRKSVKKLQQ